MCMCEYLLVCVRVWEWVNLWVMGEWVSEFVCLCFKPKPHMYKPPKQLHKSVKSGNQGFLQFEIINK